MQPVHKVICIQCPLACLVTLSVSKKGVINKVTNHQCKEGKKYAVQEFKSPTRVLTTTVRTQSDTRPMLPVRSREAVPKGVLKQCVQYLVNVTVKPPISMGDVVVSNILDTGIDVISTHYVLT